MKAFLLCLSALLLAASGLFAQTLPPRGETLRYAFELSTQRGGASGVMALRETPDTILGSMVNEFGVSVADFIYHRKKRKLKLVSVIGFLDRWYVKRVVSSDLGECLRLLRDENYIPGKRYSFTTAGDTTTIGNLKRNITYTFTPMKKPTEDETAR